MSNLKLEIKNFSGQMNFDYRISWKVECGRVAIHLNLKNNTGDFNIHECCVGSSIESGSYEQSLRDALVSAEDKWGLKLTKANLKVIQMDKSA